MSDGAAGLPRSPALGDPVAGAGDVIGAALDQQSLCGAFQVTARANADLPALRVTGAPDAISWREYAARVEAVARGLHALGLRPGDTVALLLRNRPTFNIVDMAALHVGAVPFSIYHTEPVAQMEALIQDSGAAVLISEPVFETQLAALRRGSPGLRHVVLDGDLVSGQDTLAASGDGTARDGDGTAGSGDAVPASAVVSLAEVEALRDESFDFEASWRSVGPEAIATLVYTSGTTGEPKAVEIPHRAVIASLAGVHHLAPASPAGRGVSFLPAAHITDRFICHYQTAAFGGTLTCVPDPDELWDAIVEVRPTRFFGVPRTWEKLADRARALIDPDPELRDALRTGFSRVRAEQSGRPLEGEAARQAERADALLAPIRAALGLDCAEWTAVAAAPSSYEVLELHHALGLRLAELWGMTEFMMATMNPPGRVRLGTVGVPLPEVQARLAEDGELLMRGAHACAGYRNDPERTAAIHDAEGWARTGDLARIDADGYVTIVGRKKEQMINSSGKNLIPGKIEAAIAERSPLIEYAVAIGDRRRYVTALIVLNPTETVAFAAARGLSGSHAELASHPAISAEVERAVAAGNERLARVEQVRAWRLLDCVWEPGGEEITNTLKLRRATIAEKYSRQIDALYD